MGTDSKIEGNFTSKMGKKLEGHLSAPFNSFPGNWVLAGSAGRKCVRAKKARTCECGQT